MSKVTCKCEHTFDADLPREINLDQKPEALEEILGGRFFAVTCPNCGTELKPELKVRLVSASKALRLEVYPEADRLSFYLGNLSPEKGEEVVIGYGELFERAAILRDGLDPETLEILKYYLAVKAEDDAPEGAEVRVRYEGLEGQGPGAKIHFLVAGIKEGELARLPVGMDHYGKIKADKKRLMGNEPFVTIFKGPYRSIRALELEA